jgi:hypothetical protein
MSATDSCTPSGTLGDTLPTCSFLDKAVVKLQRRVAVVRLPLLAVHKVAGHLCFSPTSLPGPDKMLKENKNAQLLELTETPAVGPVFVR